MDIVHWRCQLGRMEVVIYSICLRECATMIFKEWTQWSFPHGDWVWYVGWCVFIARFWAWHSTGNFSCEFRIYSTRTSHKALRIFLLEMILKMINFTDWRQPCGCFIVVFNKELLVTACHCFYLISPAKWTKERGKEGNDPIWLIFFQMGWNHQLDDVLLYFTCGFTKRGPIDLHALYYDRIDGVMFPFFQTGTKEALRYFMSLVNNRKSRHLIYGAFQL